MQPGKAVEQVSHRLVWGWRRGAGPGEGSVCPRAWAPVTRGPGPWWGQSLSPTGISAGPLEAQFLSEGQLCSARPAPTQCLGQQGWECSSGGAPTAPEGREAAYGHCPKPLLSLTSELMVNSSPSPAVSAAGSEALVNMPRWGQQKGTQGPRSG